MLDPDIRTNLYNKVHAMGLPAKREAVFFRKARHGTLRTIIRRLRLIQLSEAQNNRCCYCGQQTWHPEIIDGGDVPHSRRRRATLEHVVAQNHGGGEGKHNLVMACSQCNGARGDKPIAHFIGQITCNREVPISKAYARYLKKEKKRKSEKGQIKLAKTYRLLFIAAVFLPDMFEAARNEIKNKPEKVYRDPRKGLSSIRRRVVKNGMIYRKEAMAYLP